MPRITGAGTMRVLIMGVVLLSLSQAIAAATSPPGAHRSQMWGHITAIDRTANTVVIEVQHGGAQFTIRGPLSAEAVVKKGGKTVALSALHVGDEVRVHWEQTAAGHLITQLEASQPSPSLRSPLEYALRPRRSA